MYQPAVAGEILFSGINNSLRSVFTFREGSPQQAIIAVSANFFYLLELTSAGFSLIRQPFISGNLSPVLLVQSGSDWYVYANESDILGTSVVANVMPNDVLQLTTPETGSTSFTYPNETGASLSSSSAGVTMGSISLGDIVGVSIILAEYSGAKVGYDMRFKVTEDVNKTLTAIYSVTNTDTLLVGSWEPSIQAGDPVNQYAVRFIMSTQFTEAFRYIFDTESNLYWVNGLRKKMGKVAGQFSPGNYSDVNLSYTSGSDTYEIDYINTITTFGGYLWWGNFRETCTTDSNLTKDYPSRVRWSSPIDSEVVQFGTGSFIDLDTASPIIRMIPVNRSLFVCTTNEIFVGTPTSISGLPYRFTKIDLGGLSLGGSEAFTVYQGILYFISKQGFHIINENGDMEAISDNIMEDIDLSFTKYARVWANAESDRVYFYLPNSSNTYGNDGAVWVLNQETKEFTRFDIDQITGGGFFQPFSATTVAGMQSFSSLKTYQLLFTESGTAKYINVLEPEEAYAIDACYWTTAEMDMGVPNKAKIWTECTLRLFEPAAYPIQFTVTAIVNQYTKVLGTLTIPAGVGEGKINFAFPGASAQLQFTYLNPEEGIGPTFIISECVISGRLSGKEKL
jgi:hypothetical protein